MKNEFRSSRVFLRVETAAIYTIYCYLETVDNVSMEIRVTDNESKPTVFASSHANRGKLSLIPVVFLDPNHSKSPFIKIYKKFN